MSFIVPGFLDADINATVDVNTPRPMTPGLPLGMSSQYAVKLRSFITQVINLLQGFYCHYVRFLTSLIC